MHRPRVVAVVLLFSLVPSLRGGASSTSECELGHFRCANDTDLCLPQINICDTVRDCPDGSDELNCVDLHGALYYDDFFRKRPAAEHDDYDRSCALAYNGSCNCRQRDLFCQNMGIEGGAPMDLPPSSIDILDFTGNRFVRLSGESLKTLPEIVETLVMVHCEIRELGSGAFRNLTSTVKLYMDNNRVRTIPAGLFSDVNVLQILTLSHNEISELGENAFDDLHDLIELDLSYNNLSDLEAGLLAPLGNLTFLYLQGNALRSLDAGTFPNIPLNTLSLGNNIIERIAEGSFSKLQGLHKLYLSHNKLKYLANGTFDGLTQLLVLTLNDNLLTEIECGVFLPTANLTSLDFRNNVFERLQRNVLGHLDDLKHIYFDKFEMCVDAPHVRVCEPKGDGISSQEHLLDNVLLRASVWIMATVGCTGNLVVLLGRYLGGPTNNVVHSLYIKNLALSDLLMGIYLFAIAAVDHRYRGVYLQHQWRWRHSTLCSVCGFLNTLSCESSVLILSLVTWDRFVSVTQPLARKQPSPRTAGLTLLFLWSMAVLVAAAPLFDFTEGYFGKEFYSSNGVCLPLYLHNPFASGWQYSVVMFMCVNAMALLFICYAYSRMIHEIRASGVACRSTQQSQERDKVAQRFGIIVLTDCLCWVPVIVIKLAALSGMSPSEGYRKFIYASLAIYVLPINSALNPVLYTLTTTLFKKQMRRLFGGCIYKRRQDPQNSGYDSGFSLSLGVFPKGGSTRRILTYRGTQSSLTTSKNSCRRPTPV